MDHYGLMKTLGYDQTLAEYILGKYAEPHRHYHNLRHVEQVISCILAEGGLDADEIPVLIEAAYWHDVEYPCQKGSVTLFEAMSLCEYTKRAPKVDLLTVACILATAFHDRDQTPSGPVGLFLDFDMSSFSRPWEECWEDSENVRRELSQVYGEEAFLRGNVAFLSRLLERKSIYYVKKDWEEPARHNISRIVSVRKDIIANLYASLVK